MKPLSRKITLSYRIFFYVLWKIGERLHCCRLYENSSFYLLAISFGNVTIIEYITSILLDYSFPIQFFPVCSKQNYYYIFGLDIFKDFFLFWTRLNNKFRLSGLKFLLQSKKMHEILHEMSLVFSHFNFVVLSKEEKQICLGKIADGSSPN